MTERYKLCGGNDMQYVPFEYPHRLGRIMAEWRKAGQLPDTRAVGAWYWVSDGETVWPAKYSYIAAGGWTNEDTWEDFNRDVRYFALADAPLPPSK